MGRIDDGRSSGHEDAPPDGPQQSDTAPDDAPPGHGPDDAPSDHAPAGAPAAGPSRLQTLSRVPGAWDAWFNDDDPGGHVSILRPADDGPAALDPAARCPFLVADGPDGPAAGAGPGAGAVPTAGAVLGAGAVLAADRTNSCRAFGDPMAVSVRQQELVCLRPVHVNCPRHLRGKLLGGDAAMADPPRVTMRSIHPATLVSLLLVGLSSILAFSAFAFGFVSLPSADLAAEASATAAATPPATVAPGSGVTATLRQTPTAAEPTASATSSPLATPSPTASPPPTPVATATPRPSPSWPPGATADQMALLGPCPDGSGCWIYTIRPHDRFYEIAYFFGVQPARVLQLNPWLTNTGNLAPYVGRALRIPPPTARPH